MSECCRCCLRFNRKHVIVGFRNCKLQVGEVVIQEGRYGVITGLKDKQDDTIISIFHNREMFGVYIQSTSVITDPKGSPKKTRYN
jgi:hypothetical protein